MVGAGVGVGLGTMEVVDGVYGGGCAFRKSMLVYLEGQMPKIKQCQL